MMVKLLNLPIPGSGCDQIRVTHSGADVTVEYQYGERGRTATGGLFFEWAIAYRFRDEQHSHGFASESYDVLVEVEGSDWLNELREGKGRWRHFAVFFSNNGYFEVIARDWKALPERPGSLP